jgi:hypothetical protein
VVSGDLVVETCGCIAGWIRVPVEHVGAGFGTYTISECRPTSATILRPAKLPRPATATPDTPWPACPAGFDWMGDRCERRAVTPAPGLVPGQPSTQIAPPPSKVTTTGPTGTQLLTCGKGQVLSNGHCCPLGKTWIGGRCIPPTAAQPQRCPPGTKGTPPRRAPVIATRRTCPAGTRGTPPYCRPIAFKYHAKYRPRPQPTLR